MTTAHIMLLIAGGFIGLIGTLIIAAPDPAECPRINMGYDCKGKQCNHSEVLSEENN